MISIIIPTYNRADTIHKAVESALGQTGVEKEIIVVDDGSTDNTREVVEGYPSVSYVWQPNQRQAAARSHGLKFAQGEFIASLDSDDAWDPDFLASGLEALRRSGADFTFSNFRVCDNLGEIVLPDYFGSLPYTLPSPQERLSPGETRALFVSHCPSPSSSLLMPRRLLKNGWDVNTQISDDWFMVLSAVLGDNASCVIQDRPTWTKNRGEDNICDGHDSLRLANKEIADCRRLLEKYAEYLSNDEKLLFEQRLAQSLDDAAYGAAVSGQFSEMLKFQTKALATRPSAKRFVRLARLIVSTSMPSRRK